MLSLRKVCWGMTQVFSNLERKVSSKESQSWIAVVNTAFLSSWSLHNCGGRQKIKFWTRAFLIVINALKKIKHSDMLDIWRVSGQTSLSERVAFELCVIWLLRRCQPDKYLEKECGRKRKRKVIVEGTQGRDDQSRDKE